MLCLPPAAVSAVVRARKRSSDTRRRGCGLEVLLLLLTLALSLPAGFCQNANVNLQILDDLLQQYDRRATPTNHLNNATTVNCELYIRSFGSIDPNSMDYQVDLYLRQSWVDERLNHDDIKQPLDLNDPNLVKAIWKPEVYFPNAKHAEFQFVTVPNVLVRINPNGEILYMLRLKLVFACMMELSKFPLDSQVCTMEIASFSKTMKELNLSWKSDAPIKMYKNMRMPQFEMEEIVPTTCQESFQIVLRDCQVEPRPKWELENFFPEGLPDRGVGPDSERDAGILSSVPLEGEFHAVPFATPIRITYQVDVVHTFAEQTDKALFTG
ncbi:glycine receptor subunit alpha-2-like [Penaeus japonicus]|uniref:glycine receptor subunit alpha-2-like n=1 Tax=Penaeus japonicus TaxID=27405 RepID=UPI001C7101AD|nr:glycine receptor subunit alpha-2-like [Penaeus japonicus]